MYPGLHLPAVINLAHSSEGEEKTSLSALQKYIVFIEVLNAWGKMVSV